MGYMFFFAALLVRTKYYLEKLGCVLTAVGVASVTVTLLHLHLPKCCCCRAVGLSNKRIVCTLTLLGVRARQTMFVAILTVRGNTVAALYLNSSSIFEVVPFQPTTRPFQTINYNNQDSKDMPGEYTWTVFESFVCDACEPNRLPRLAQQFAPIASSFRAL